MIDARIAVGLPSHPKTKKLIRRVGEPGAWRLVCLFLWAAQTRPDGDLSGMTGEDIELAADWQGEEGAFIGALVEVGFIDGEEGCYEIHDWEQHNPWAAGASRRSEVARQNAMKKWGADKSSDNAKNRSQRLAEARKKGKHTKEEWETMKAVCGNACVKCGSTELDLSKDHIVPICKGGSDGIENIQPMCHRCNAGKGGSDSADLRPENWSEMLAERLQNACQTHAPSPSPSPYPSPYPSPSPSPSPKEKIKPAASDDACVPEAFEEAWQAYPKREGSNSRRAAVKAWNARVRAGVDPAELVAGVRRYAAFCAAKGSIGTAYVKQAAAFFGPDAHWSEQWAVQAEQASMQPAQRPAPPGKRWVAGLLVED